MHRSTRPSTGVSMLTDLISRGLSDADILNIVGFDDCSESAGEAWYRLTRSKSGPSPAERQALADVCGIPVCAWDEPVAPRPKQRETAAIEKQHVRHLTPSLGATLLRKFLVEKEMNYTDGAKLLGVSKDSVRQWSRAVCVPSPKWMRGLEEKCGIPEQAWFSRTSATQETSAPKVVAGAGRPTRRRVRKISSKHRRANGSLALQPLPASQPVSASMNMLREVVTALTQRKIASEVGTNQVRISGWCRGRVPNEHFRKLLAEKFGIPEDGWTVGTTSPKASTENASPMITASRIKTGRETPSALPPLHSWILDSLADELITKDQAFAMLKKLAG